MYNVFKNIVHTTKAKSGVREESTSLDEQKVYVSLLYAYLYQTQCYNIWSVTNIDKARCHME
jgi:hypothetical protein